MRAASVVVPLGDMSSALFSDAFFAWFALIVLYRPTASSLIVEAILAVH